MTDQDSKGSKGATVFEGVTVFAMALVDVDLD
jgi:hypothetical protein